MKKPTIYQAKDGKWGVITPSSAGPNDAWGLYGSKLDAQLAIDILTRNNWNMSAVEHLRLDLPKPYNSGQDYR